MGELKNGVAVVFLSKENLVGYTNQYLASLLVKERVKKAGLKIDKELALTIKDFLERYKYSLVKYYNKLYKRNSSECDYSLILEELSLRINRTNCYLEELDKALESSE